jgi:putative SOS response-associated peptidase YedK
MCGRFVLKAPPAELITRFEVDKCIDFSPRYNIAPTQAVPVVRESSDGKRHVVMARWGLMPSWMKDPAEFNHPINAKAETAAIKPMFRHAFRKSRVLVPADAFYEWKAIDGKKQPYLIRMRDASPFGMAGLVEHGQGPDREVLTFAILTTEPNPLMADIHNRMPVIVKPEDYGGWLNPELSDVAELQKLVGPYPERLMEAYPVSRRVNSAANDGPDLIGQIS